MSAWNFAKIKTYLIGAGALWALLAFIAWHYESTCGMFLSGACWATYWDGLRHVLLLKWVWDFQTLMAGVLTLIAGSAVIYVAWYNSNETKRRETSRLREEARISCLLAGQYMNALTQEMKGLFTRAIPNNSSTRVETLVVKCEQHIASLHAICRPIGWIVASTLSDISIELRSTKNETNPTETLRRFKLLSAKSVSISFLLIAISDKLSKDGKYNFITDGKPSSKPLREFLAETNIQPNELGMISEMFEWND